MPGIHPTTRLACWLAALIAIQCLHGWRLAAAFALASAVFPLAGPATLRHALRLIRRMRWLLASLFVVFAWGVAGDPLWSGFAAPSREGLAEAATHLGRILLVLLAVATLLESTPLPQLMAACRGLLRPCRLFGLDPDRGVVRLMLVLHYVDTLPRPRDWRALLEPPAAADEAPQVVRIAASPFRPADYLALSCAAVALIFLCLP